MKRFVVYEPGFRDKINELGTGKSFACEYSNKGRRKGLK